MRKIENFVVTKAKSLTVTIGNTNEQNHRQLHKHKTPSSDSMIAAVASLHQRKKLVTIILFLARIQTEWSWFFVHFHEHTTHNTHTRL